MNTQHLPLEDIQLLYSNNNLRPRHFLKANGSWGYAVDQWLLSTHHEFHCFDRACNKILKPRVEGTGSGWKPVEGTRSSSVEFTWLANDKNSTEAQERGPGEAIYLSLGCLTEIQALPKRCLLLWWHMHSSFKRTFFTLNHKISLLLPSFKAASYEYPPRFKSRQNYTLATLKSLRAFLLPGSWWNWIVLQTLFCECECGLLLRGYYLVGRDLIQEGHVSPRNDVLHITAFCTMAEVWSKERVYQPLLWWDMSVPLVCKEDLHSEADWSTACNHREPFPPNRYEWVPSQPKCTDQIT